MMYVVYIIKHIHHLLKEPKKSPPKKNLKSEKLLTFEIG